MIMNLIENYCPEYLLFKNLRLSSSLWYSMHSGCVCQCSGEIMIPEKSAFCGKER
jgi:hypothetical protein